MDGLQKVKQEYEQAKAELLKVHDINGKKLCVRGRAYRAMRMAPQFTGTPEKLKAYREVFDRLAAEADKLINEYNFHGHAYAAFAGFANVVPDIDKLPECQCEGCRDGN